MTGIRYHLELIGGQMIERSGRPIGERDLLIGAIALAHGATVVTHNGAELARVPRLRVADRA